ncbi:MAG: YdiU family protein [Pseudomonadota bacterium]
MMFDDVFVSALSGHTPICNVPQQVVEAHYSFVTPTPAKQPSLRLWSNSTAALLDLADTAKPNDDIVSLLAGNTPTTASFASCYGGHQFGHWAGQLGDGRAITLGDKYNAQKALYELQLKGAGVTPYSRRGDGRAVLRSSIREFICSEAMHHLGVPTTRALSLVTTGDEVIRDMFYDGRAAYEPSAIVSRVAPSFVRFGNFELFAQRRDTIRLKELSDFIIDHHYPEVRHNDDGICPYFALFSHVCRNTAKLIIEWMRVGFVHGVMNTDNLSILGLTIDYGPFGWLDAFDSQFTPNTSDRYGRYAFAHQASIAHWNLHKLSEALSAISTHKRWEDGLRVFTDTYNDGHERMMCAKLGMSPAVIKRAYAENRVRPLIERVYTVLSEREIDYTLFFNCLKEFIVVVNAQSQEAQASLPLHVFDRAYYEGTAAEHPSLKALLMDYLTLGCHYDNEMDKAMVCLKASNPVIIPRNYLIQNCIEAAKEGDYEPLHALYRAIQAPYDQHSSSDYVKKRPEWARYKAGCSALSCSS